MPSLRFIFNRIVTSARAYKWRQRHGPDGSRRIDPLSWAGMARFYHHWLPPIVLLAVLSWLASVLYFNPPSPPIGVYMGGLACLAAIVTIWPPQSSWSKAAWMLVFFAMFGLEIHTLYKDRETNQSQQRAARKESNDAFKSIADGLKIAITENQRAFDATMSRMKGLGEISAENLAQQTGGKTFCFYLASALPESDGSHALTLFVTGKHVMKNLAAEYYAEPTPNSTPQEAYSSFLLRKMIIPGRDVLPGAHMSDVHLNPGAYQFNFWAVNGWIQQSLKFKKVGTHGLSQSISVRRDGKILYEIVDDKVTVPYKAE